MSPSRWHWWVWWQWWDRFETWKAEWILPNGGNGGISWDIIKKNESSQWWLWWDQVRHDQKELDLPSGGNGEINFETWSSRMSPPTGGINWDMINWNESFPMVPMVGSFETWSKRWVFPMVAMPWQWWDWEEWVLTPAQWGQWRDQLRHDQVERW